MAAADSATQAAETALYNLKTMPSFGFVRTTLMKNAEGLHLGAQERDEAVFDAFQSTMLNNAETAILYKATLITAQNHLNAWKIVAAVARTMSLSQEQRRTLAARVDLAKSYVQESARSIPQSFHDNTSALIADIKDDMMQVAVTPKVSYAQMFERRSFADPARIENISLKVGPAAARLANNQMMH